MSGRAKRPDQNFCPFCYAPAHEDGLRWLCGTMPWPEPENYNRSWACEEIERLRDVLAEEIEKQATTAKAER